MSKQRENIKKLQFNTDVDDRKSRSPSLVIESRRPR